MTTVGKVMVVGWLVTICVMGWFLCGALRDARRLLEVARAWENYGLYDTLLGNIRHGLSLTNMIDTPRDPLYICGVPSSITWPKLLPLFFNLQHRLDCLEEQVEKAKQEQRAFVQSFFHHLVIAGGVVVSSVWLAKTILRSNHHEERSMNASQYQEDNTQLTLVTQGTRYTEQNVFYTNVDNIVLFVFFQSQLKKIIFVAASNEQIVDKIVPVLPIHTKTKNRMITFASSHAEIVNINTKPSSPPQPSRIITVAASHPQQDLIIKSSAHDERQARTHEASNIHQVHYQDTKMTPNQPFNKMQRNFPQIANSVCFNAMERQFSESVVSDVLVDVVEDSHFPLKIVLELMEELVNRIYMVSASMVVDDEAMNEEPRDVAEQATENPASTGDVTKVQMKEEEAEKTVRRSLYLPPRYIDTILGPNEDFLQYLRQTYPVTIGRNFVTSKVHIIGRKADVLAAYASMKTRMKECKDQGQNVTNKTTQV